MASNTPKSPWKDSTVPKTGIRGWPRYFALAVLAWASGFHDHRPIGNPLAYYSKYMPALVLFYLGYPLVFSVLIYGLKLGKRELFLAMIAGIVVVEIVFTRNMLLLTLPICLLAIPISLGPFGMVSFMPLWIAQGTLNENRKWAAATLGVWAVGVFFNILTQVGGHH
jgi:hypothetical protein